MIYKYVGATNGQEALTLLKYFIDSYSLNISDPRTFNDPFEFKVDLELAADDVTMRNRFFADIPEASEDQYKDWHRSHSKQSQWYIKQQTRNALLSTYGLFCASKADTNLLLWSHYARNHTGFCVGLDEAELRSLPHLAGGANVTYQDDAPKFNYYSSDPQSFANCVFGYKASAWHYEDEFRLIFDYKGLLRFPPSALKEVTLGCRAFMELRDYAKNNCGGGHVRYFELSEDFQNYRFSKMPVDARVIRMTSFF